MQYKNRPLNEGLNTLTEFFFISSCAGPAIGQVLADMALTKGLPSKYQTVWLEYALQFCALCCARAEEVVDFDIYLGEFYVDQFDSYELEWPEGQEHKPQSYLETSYDLQSTGFQLNFVDLLLTRLCQEYVTALDNEQNEVGPFLSNLLCLGDAPDVGQLIRAIDLALYQAGVSLKNERFELTEPGDGFAVVHTWSGLGPDTDPKSDTGVAMPQAAYAQFLEMRTMVFELPPGLSRVVLDDGSSFRIYLAEETQP